MQLSASLNGVRMYARSVFGVTRRYGGGRVGLSDTYTGAFWVADALFAFANAGASGFHLHWGKGGEPSGNSQPNTGVQTNFEKVS
jgi:hypothetical protein